MDLCKAPDVHIANGRCGIDAFRGKTTCKRTGLIDYIILSSELFPMVINFDVIDFDHLISDMHNTTSFSILQNDLNTSLSLITATCDYEGRSCIT